MSTAFEADVSGQHIAGLLWHGECASVPTLALHGWLDNAASFTPLAPHLRVPALLAVDLPGHGLSDHRPAPGGYAIWDDLLDLLALADTLGWERFNLLGHSRGAFIAVLLAAAVPERIHRVALLDGIYPPPVAAADAAQLLRRYITDQRGVAKKRMPLYDDVDSAVAVWSKASGMQRDAAQLIVERGLKPVAGGRYTWRSDPRLMLGSAFKLTEAHNRAFLNAVEAPMLALLATQGYGGRFGVAEVLKDFPDLRFEVLDAGHHLHMGPDASAIGSRLERFLLE